MQIPEGRHLIPAYKLHWYQHLEHSRMDDGIYHYKCGCVIKVYDSGKSLTRKFCRVCGDQDGLPLELEPDYKEQVTH